MDKSISPTLQQAVKKYKKILIIELLFLIVLVFIFFLLRWSANSDFVLGYLSAFIPFAAFIVLLFYKNKKNSAVTLTPLYRAEAIKFILTIALIITAFKWFEVTNFIAFFTGFILSLALSSTLPFCFNKSY